MKKLFVSIALAKLLKEKGFNEGCLAWSWPTPQEDFMILGQEENGVWPDRFHLTACVPEIIPIPMYAQVIDWFREKHNIEIYCPNYYKHSKGYKSEYECRVNGKQLSHPDQGHALGSVELYPTYYQAVDRAIREALKLI